MRISYRQDAIALRAKFDDPLTTLTTIEKLFSKSNQTGLPYSALTPDQRDTIRDSVEEQVRAKERRINDEITIIHTKVCSTLNRMQIAHDLKWEGVKTKIYRELDGRKWLKLSGDVQDLINNQVTEALIKSQSSRSRILKKFSLDGRPFDAIKDLHEWLCENYPEQIVCIKIFSDTVYEHFWDRSEPVIAITSVDVDSHLTLAARNEYTALNYEPDPNSIPCMANQLSAELADKGIDIAGYKIEEMIVHRRTKTEKKWKSLSSEQRKDIVEEVRKEVEKRASISGGYLVVKNEWLVDINGEQKPLTNKALHKIARDTLGKGCLTRQPFGRALYRLRDDPTCQLIQGSQITDLDALIEALRHYEKILPATIYKIVVLVGEYAGCYYIGSTQNFIAVRFDWHKRDAYKKENINNSRKLHLAIRNACEYGDIREVLSIEVLEENVPSEKITEVETMYIQQYWGDDILNTHRNGSSHGGRKSNVPVIYRGVTYGFIEGVRAVAADYGITDADEFSKFHGRVRGRYYRVPSEDRMLGFEQAALASLIRKK